MKRLSRWIYRILFFGAIVITFASGGMWIRSVSTIDYLLLEIPNISPGLTIGVITTDGKGLAFFEVKIMRYRLPDSVYFEGDQKWNYTKCPISVGIGFPASSRQFLGFGFGDESSPGIDATMHARAFAVWLPMWVLILLDAGAAAWLFPKLRRHPQSGHCRRCGYDLRATPQRCPECGALAELVRKS